MESTTCKEENVSRGTASEFITERRYLKNVTSKTLAWYEQSFKTFTGALESEATIKQRIVELRKRGASATSVNTWLRCINAYLKWQGVDLKIPRLKEEQKVLATLNPDQVKRLVDFKPRGRNQIRTHTAAMLMLDGGYRVARDTP